MTEFWVRADQEEAAFRGDELRTLGLGAVEALTRSGVFQRAEDLIEVECDACGDRHIEQVTVIVSPPGSEARLYIRCKESGRVRVEPERVQVQRIDLDRLARAISKALQLGTPRVIAEGRLWLLGTIQFGDRTRDVFIARGASWEDGRSLADHARLAASPCPVILVPNLLPGDPIWLNGEWVVLSMSEFDWFGDDAPSVIRKITGIAAEYDRQPQAAEGAVFRKQGGMWLLVFGGKIVHQPDTLVGIRYVCELLRTPLAAIEAARLAGVSVESTKLVQAAGIPLADEATIRAVRADLEAKKAEYECLPKNDWARRGPLKDQIPKLESYLREVATNRGQARKVAGTAQRSRTAVTNAINRAIEQISAQHPDLGHHLKASIKTGTSPIYAPAEVPDWRF